MGQVAFRRLLILLTVIRTGISLHHRGNWQRTVDSADEFVQYYKWNGPASFDDHAAIIESYHTGSPCRALTIRDNCFSHNPERADSLMLRKWMPNIASKVHVDVSQSNTLADIMLTLQNKTISIMGDSTVLSVFSSLVCHLSQQETPQYSLTWLFNKKEILVDKEGQTVCPQHVSCYLLSGEVYFPENNISIWYQQLNSYSKRSKQQLHTVVESNAHRPDIVLINFGVHYNDYKSYITDLLSFKGDMQGIMERQRTDSHHISWHWIESFPQHFTYGYYNFSADSDFRTSLLNRDKSDTDLLHSASWSNSSLHCVPVTNMTHYYQEDWRNRLAEVALPEFYTNHRVIRIAEPLYSQWDAHVDYGDSKRVTRAAADCTHYCTGSGVFRFVLSEVVSSIKKCLHGCPAKHFFYPPLPAPPQQPRTVNGGRFDKKKRDKSKGAASAKAGCINTGEGGLRNRQAPSNC